jgi:hypothetical protein
MFLESLKNKFPIGYLTFIMNSLLLISLCLILQTSHAQQVKARALELTVLGRYDYHADYTSRYGNRSYTNQTALAGVSYGWKMAYQHPFNKSSNIKAGIGYYRLGINEIRQSTPFGIPRFEISKIQVPILLLCIQQITTITIPFH